MTFSHKHHLSISTENYFGKDNSKSEISFNGDNSCSPKSADYDETTIFAMDEDIEATPCRAKPLKDSLTLKLEHHFQDFNQCDPEAAERAAKNLIAMQRNLACLKYEDIQNATTFEIAKNALDSDLKLKKINVEHYQALLKQIIDLRSKQLKKIEDVETEIKELQNFSERLQQEADPKVAKLKFALLIDKLRMEVDNSKAISLDTKDSKYPNGKKIPSSAPPSAIKKDVQKSAPQTAPLLTDVKLHKHPAGFFQKNLMPPKGIILHPPVIKASK